MAHLFGTDGIRGVANKPPLDPLTVVRIGQHLRQRQRRLGRSQRTLIARDTRISGPMIEAALVAGLCSAGGEPLLAGVLPTPAAARLARHRFACDSVVISASHNPWHDNGVKLIGSDGYKWSSQEEEEFEAALFSGDQPVPAEGIGAAESSVGTPTPVTDAADWYVGSVLESLHGRKSLGGLRLAVDCANGAAVPVAPALFEQAGARVTALAAAPDGYNINLNSGALCPKALQATVVEQGADAGAAFDGDADRLVLVDETGTVLDGDGLLWILARHLAETGKLRRAVVVGTVMSNFGLERALGTLGVQLVRAPVGDRYVVELMRQSGSQLGGEPSGHIVWLDHTTTGDGILTALAVLQIASLRQRRLSELRTGLDLLPQIQTNVEAKNPRAAVADEHVQRVTRAAGEALEGKGRVLVRASGTEPVVRILVEGEDVGLLATWAEELAAAVRAVSAR